MARTKTPRSETTTANDRGRKKGAQAVTDVDVARRAYDLYLARKREDGHDVEDWLQAERELRGANPQ
jgi:hypothetical protein